MQNLLNKLFGNQPAEPERDLSPAQQELNSLLETAATALEQGYHDTALETYQRGLELARSRNDPASEEHFLSGIGAAHVAQEDYDTALPVLNEALELARRLDDPRAMARCLNNMGSYYAQQEKWGTAQTYHQQALDAARKSNSGEMIALALENLAKDYLNQDNPGYAQHLLKEAVVLAQAHQQLPQASRVVGLLADATASAGDHASAQKLYTQAAQLAEQTGQLALQMRWLQALAGLEIENRNFQQAIEHAQTAENLALRLGTESAEFFMNSALELSTAYQLSGNSPQAEEYATRALAQARSTGDAKHEAEALMRLGMAAHTMANYEQAEELLGEALTYFEDGTLTDRDEHLQLLLALGDIAIHRAKPDQALKQVQQALELAREAEDIAQQAKALHLLGSLSLAQSDQDQALTYWRQALNMLGATNPSQAAQIHCDIAGARRAMGDFKTALVEYEKGLVLLNQIKQPAIRGLVLSNAATLYTEVGDVDTAQAFYEESIDIARSLDDKRAQGLRLGNLGWFYALTGRLRAAVETLEYALAISRDLDDKLMIAVQSNNLARAYYLMEDYEAARTLHKSSITTATAIGAERWQGIFQADQGDTMVALGRLDEAEELYHAALTTSINTGDMENYVRSQARLARLYAQTGRAGEAAEMAHESYQRARKMHYTRGQAEALVARGDAAEAQGDSETAQQHSAAAQRLYKILHAPQATTLEPEQTPTE